MKHFLLFYTTAPDYLERRPDFRALHLEMAWAAAKRGDLVLGGVLTGPADSAVLLFRAEDCSVAEDFARADPYVREGLVSAWHVREWTTVVGPLAIEPILPTG
jgi:uncharacterized protein YciI